MTTAYRTEITVKPLSEDDIPAAARIESLCFGRFTCAEMFVPSYRMECAAYFGAYSDGVLVGYAGAFIVSDSAEVDNIAVLPEYRRKGAATALLSALENEARERGAAKLRLEVRESNTAALSLYEKAGFYRVGVRRRYYTSPCEDAILLDKDI